jgi:predicted transposase YdaD
MPLFDEPPLHDFPDRAIRRLLEDPHNLRHLLAAVLPDLVTRFDFDRVERVDRAFLLDDWRRRESDLLFRLPFQPAPGDEAAPPALVCLLIEHQSEPDPWMPLRVLVYAALYWEREWKTWASQHTRGEPFHLSPVIPIVFHTGPHPWRTYRELADLIGGPEELRVFSPRWQPLFWDLTERSAQQYLQMAGEFLTALAVVRAEREDTERFRTVFIEVLRRLEALSQQEPVRWHDLLWFVLSWGVLRRPAEEREPLLQAAQSSQTDALRREEVRRMTETITRTWEQELLARGEARGEARGREEGQLEAAREILQMQLEDRFGPLREELVQRIKRADDLERLRAALHQVLHITEPAELEL